MASVKLDEFIEGLDPNERERLAQDDPQLRKTFDSFDKIETLFARVRLPSQMESLADETPDLDLPGFQKIEILGEGTFGVVYLARDNRLNRHVAIKIPRSRWQVAGDNDRFTQEAKLAAKLNHPGIVTLYDFVEHDDRCYLVSEFVEGGTLAEKLNASPLDHEQAATIALQIAEALSHAHRANVVHRDLKPANILLDQDGNPRIADFGLAILDDDQALSLEHVAGTVEYMSPERLPGENQFLDGRADIWSLGVVLYELLTGKLPFTGRDRDEVFAQIRQREPKPLQQLDASIPTALREICLKCLAKDPQDRFSSADEVARNLHRYLQRDRIGNRLRWGAVAASLLAIVSISAFAIQSLRNPLHATRPSAHATRPSAQAIASAQTTASAQAIVSSTIQATNEVDERTAIAQLNLRVESMRVRHYRYDDQDVPFDLGSIGLSSREVQQGDDLRIELKFSEPAYYYLLEFTNKGETILHSSSHGRGDSAVRRLEFPSGAMMLGLDDGIGMNAIAVVASAKPLPPFAKWKDRLADGLSWSSFEAEGIWRFENNGFDTGSFIRQRSSVKEHAKPPSQFETLCAQLSTHGESTVVHALAFPVHAKATSNEQSD